MAGENLRAVPLASTHLPHPACCIAFSNVYPDILVVGTYSIETSALRQLDLTGQEPDPHKLRKGELIFFRLQNNELWVHGSL
jgi:hypothetical protein